MERNIKTMKKQNNSNIGILGYGEVGRAIANFYKRVKIKDLERDDGLEGIGVLNVCIPWTNDFIKVVTEEIKKTKPKLTIIHSTVPPGVTKKVANSTRAFVVHSPVRGVHPDIYRGIKTFVKYIGTDDKKAGELAKRHLKSLGIKTRVFQPSVITETGKLLSTSYYGLCIAWHGEMKKICDKAGVDFEKAVTDFNKTYNQGYMKLGKSNVVRPVLYPPKDGIGGSCVCQNAQIIKKYFQSQAIDLILKYKARKNKNED
jgi:UDP-N-acetyl-D-mannosaminuronate dehydrogenase